MTNKVRLIRDIKGIVNIKAGTVLDLYNDSPFDCTLVIFNNGTTLVNDDEIVYIVDDDTMVQVCTKNGAVEAECTFAEYREANSDAFDQSFFDAQKQDLIKMGYCAVHVGPSELDVLKVVGAYVDFSHLVYNETI